MGQFPPNRLRAYMPMEDLEGKREFRFEDIRGYDVLNTTGHKVGTVKEVFVDPNTLEPCFAYLDYQKFMNFNMKAYLVPWEELIIGKDFVQTRWTEEELLPETRAEQEKNLARHGGPGHPATSGQRVQSSREMSADLDETAEMEGVTAYDTGEGDVTVVPIPGRGSR